MKKSLAVAAVAVLALLLTSASVPSGTKQGNKQISCVIDIQVVCNDVECFWQGPIKGCILDGGTIEFREQPQNRWPGKTEHFFEKFIIYAPGGGTISGDNAGVWNFATFKFRANGWVADASPEWAYLVGAKFHEMGTTSDPSIWPITGFGTVMTLH